MSGIRFYQKNISPATPPSCRYHPTCSTYALQAIEKHGALKGGVMGAARIIRCNPFVEGGVDQVPDYFTIFRNPANVDDEHIPEFLMPVDQETRAELSRLLEKHGADLLVSEKLPPSLEVLQGLADVVELSQADLAEEFSAAELAYLSEIEIFPDLKSADYKYFTLAKSEQNEGFLSEVENFEVDLEFGSDFPLVVLERTGIWYTNLPRLLNAFLSARGITQADLENKSYHLWLVLKAMDAEK